MDEEAHLVGELHALASSTRELAAIVRLQQQWRTDPREDLEQRERNRRVALARQRDVVVQLDTMVLVIEQELEVSVRTALEVDQVDLAAAA
jgi:hypothetical protein